MSWVRARGATLLSFLLCLLSASPHLRLGFVNFYDAHRSPRCDGASRRPPFCAIIANKRRRRCSLAADRTELGGDFLRKAISKVAYPLVPPRRIGIIILSLSINRSLGHELCGPLALPSRPATRLRSASSSYTEVQSSWRRLPHLTSPLLHAKHSNHAVPQYVCFLPYGLLVQLKSISQTLSPDGRHRFHSTLYVKDLPSCNAALVHIRLHACI